MRTLKEDEVKHEGRTEETAGPLTLTVPQAAQQLGIGRNSAYEAIRRGELPVLKIGKRILVPRQAVAKMLEAVVSKALETATNG